MKEKSISGSLGISKERLHEIYAALEKEKDGHLLISDILLTVLGESKNPKEGLLVGFLAASFLIESEVQESFKRTSHLLAKYVDDKPVDSFVKEAFLEMMKTVTERVKNLESVNGLEINIARMLPKEMRKTQRALFASLVGDTECLAYALAAEESFREAGIADKELIKELLVIEIAEHYQLSPKQAALFSYQCALE